MIRDDISKKDYLKILKSIKGGYIYNYNGKMIKFDKTFAGQMMTKKRINPSTTPDIKVDQIDWLSNIGRRIKYSYLPEGIISYEHTPVGVIYPRYFEGYDSLLELSNEDSDILLSNMRMAILNNIELTDNGIYNTDFAGKNVLYKDNDVELIDIDGKHVKRAENSNYNQAYGYFIPDMYRIIYEKLVRIYGKENSKEIANELRTLFKSYTYMNRETPLEIMDEVEKMRILK